LGGSAPPQTDAYRAYRLQTVLHADFGFDPLERWGAKWYKWGSGRRSWELERVAKRLGVIA